MLEMGGSQFYDFYVCTHTHHYELNAAFGHNYAKKSAQNVTTKTVYVRYAEHKKHLGEYTKLAIFPRG